MGSGWERKKKKRTFMTNLARVFKVNTIVSFKNFDCMWGCPKTQLGSDKTERATEKLRKQKPYLISPCVMSGPGSSVGIPTGYELDGPGIESRWGRDFPHQSRPTLGHIQPPVRWVPGLSRGWTAARAWRWPLTPFYCCGQERVELCLYSPYGPYGLYRASVPVPM